MSEKRQGEGGELGTDVPAEHGETDTDRDRTTWAGSSYPLLCTTAG